MYVPYQYGQGKIYRNEVWQSSGLRKNFPLNDAKEKLLSGLHEHFRELI
jgi:hypothetical protein